MSPVPDLPDPDAIAAAVATCPSVTGLSGGVAGEIATYLPGRRVSGVRTLSDGVEVHVVARYGARLHEVDAEVRAAVTAAVGQSVRIDVVVADVEDPFADQEEPEPPKAIEAGPSAASPPGTAGTPVPAAAATLPAAPAP